MNYRWFLFIVLCTGFAYSIEESSLIEDDLTLEIPDEENKSSPEGDLFDLDEGSEEEISSLDDID